MLISVINQSKGVLDDELDIICKTIQIQLTRDVSPAWEILSPTITFNSKDPHAYTIYVIDNDSQELQALGFHLEESNDTIDGYVMCEPILDNGGTVMLFDSSNPGKYTISGTLSHEVIELVFDRFTNIYYDNSNGISWCGELCDPVEQIGYGIEVGNINVSVSDFLLPNFWDPHSTSKWNFLNSLHGPFTILDGGYAVQRNNGPGSEQQVFGHAMPQWRKDMKMGKFARMNKR
jgi:hypothetical protein